jgi:hypothetical protein
MSTTCHTAVAALALAATTTLTIGVSTPGAQAQRADTGFGYGVHRTDPPDIGAVVALRRAQQSQYLVDHGLLTFR